MLKQRIYLLLKDRAIFQIYLLISQSKIFPILHLNHEILLLPLSSTLKYIKHKALVFLVKSKCLESIL